MFASYINYPAVLVSAIAAMIIGSLWYGPLFGKQWMAMMGISKPSMDAAAKQAMMKSYGLMFVGSLVMACVLAHNLVYGSSYLHLTGWNAGFQVGFWNWLGFVAPVTLGSVLWEKKSWSLWVLNNGYYVITLIVMGSILALWQ